MDPDVTLPSGNELQLIRIIQESLTNVRKHSRATTASVDVRRRDGTLRLAVTDNGFGFSQGTLGRGVFPRFGLSTMRERAESIGASFAIESAPGGGTSICVDIPLSAS